MSDPSPGTIRAAGGVVVRNRSTPGGVPEVAVVHRARYGDWSLPKGKLDPGESEETAALREVEDGDLHPALPPGGVPDGSQRGLTILPSSVVLAAGRRAGSTGSARAIASGWTVSTQRTYGLKRIFTMTASSRTATRPAAWLRTDDARGAGARGPGRRITHRVRS